MNSPPELCTYSVLWVWAVLRTYAHITMTISDGILKQRFCPRPTALKHGGRPTWKSDGCSESIKKEIHSVTRVGLKYQNQRKTVLNIGLQGEPEMDCI